MQIPPAQGRVSSQCFCYAPPLIEIHFEDRLLQLLPVSLNKGLARRDEWRAVNVMPAINRTPLAPRSQVP